MADYRDFGAGTVVWYCNDLKDRGFGMVIRTSLAPVVEKAGNFGGWVQDGDNLYFEDEIENPAIEHCYPQNMIAVADLEYIPDCNDKHCPLHPDGCPE